MVLTDNEFALGTIDIELAYPAAAQQDTEDWVPFNISEWQVSSAYDRLAKIVSKQCSSRRIRATCRYYANDKYWLRLRLYVNDGAVARATFSNATQSLQFLELLTVTDQRQELFDNVSVARDSQTVTPFGTRKEPRSLLDIFVHMPSPTRTQIDGMCDAEILKFIDQFLERSSPAGMKTDLYRYQKRSLWKILQRELAPQKVLQPHIIEFTAMDGTSLYLNSVTNVVTTEPPLQDDIAGGIICEDMGTGKTCLCLAVIMATKGLHASVGNGNILRTDLLKAQETNGPHSLRDIAAAGVLEAGIDWKQWEHDLPKDIVEKMLKHPACYEWCDISPLMLERERRKDVVFPTFDIYTSCATLVIVPNNLVAQWTGEIYKHVSDGQLRFLLLDSIKKPVPSAKELVSYDLVLMTESRFASEYSAGGFDFQGISRLCQCPYIRNTRIRDCKCDQKTEKSNYVSPLIQVHWKRIITDEGHRLASHCRQSELATKLFSNWTWICTGTPTPNLTESANAGRSAQIEDFKRLGTLLGNALRLQPFKDDKKLWNKLITAPFIEGQLWAVSHLENLLGRIMIRNRKADIERDVVLPPLYQKQVDLDFDYYQWVAHNCQIAMIGLNAILSKREGPDYLFSKNNVKPLRETVHNLWQSCLWHSIDLKWLQTSYENCFEAIEKVKNGSDDYGEDNPVLYKILETFRIALNDPVFMQMMTKHSPPFLISGLPPLMKEKWGWAKGDKGVYEPMHGNQMLNDHCIVDGDLVVDLMADVRNALKQNDTKDLFVYNPVKDTLRSIDQAKREDTGHEDEEIQKTFYNKNVFSDVKIISSLSSKINYLVDEISKYHKTEKCIIFSQHYNEMQEIYLALQLAKLNPLMYLGRGENAVKSSHTFTTFNTAEGFNVIIMSVQKAAYGINLSAASRVYFVSPVWQTAMEQQAIKRAHRLGQTRPVYVETLVIRNTIEYELLKRRKALGDRQQGSKEFYADRKLQNILNHATFVPLPSHIRQTPEGSFHQAIKPLETEIWFIPPEKPARVSPPVSPAPGNLPTPPLGDDILDVEEMDIEDNESLKPTGKKRKVVSFDIDNDNDDASLVEAVVKDSTMELDITVSAQDTLHSKQVTEKPRKKAKAKKRVTFAFE